jgi:hypothetical protein
MKFSNRLKYMVYYYYIFLYNYTVLGIRYFFPYSLFCSFNAAILGCAVRFRLKRNDAKIKQIFFLFEAKKSVFRLFRFEAEHWKSQAKRKRVKRKNQSKLNGVDIHFCNMSSSHICRLHIYVINVLQVCI